MVFADVLTAVSGIASDFPDLILLATVGGVVSLGVFMLRRIAKAGR